MVSCYKQLSYYKCFSQKHEAGVLALLAKADRTAEERVGEKVVFEAMADTLSDAWGTLIAHLERRRSLLQHASDFFDRALEVNNTTVAASPSDLHSVTLVFFPLPS